MNIKTKKGLPKNVRQKIDEIYEGFYTKYNLGQILHKVNIINAEIGTLKYVNEQLELAEKKVELAANIIKIINSGNYPKNFSFRSILMIFPELLTMEFDKSNPIAYIEPDAYDKAMLIIMGKSVLEDKLMGLKHNLFGDDEVSEEGLRRIFGVTEDQKEIHIETLSKKLKIEEKNVKNYLELLMIK